MRILEALSKVTDIADFRLGSLLTSLGMDTQQTAPFWRELVKEAREVVPLIAKLQQDVAQRDSRIATLEGKVAAQAKELQKALAANEQFAAQHHQLRQMASQLGEKAEVYDGMVALLDGRYDRQSLYALARLMLDLHERACHGAPAPGVSLPPQTKAQVRELLYGRGLKAIAQKVFHCPDCGADLRFLKQGLERFFDF